MHTDCSYNEFRWNREGNEIDGWERGSCTQFKDHLNRVTNQQPEKKAFAFQIDTSANAQNCVNSTAIKGYDIYTASSKEEIPTQLRKGYDYDEPSLWDRDKKNVYVLKQEVRQTTASRFWNMFDRTGHSFS